MLRMILLEVSIGITFAQFCVTVVFNLVKLYLSIRRRYRQNQGYNVNKDTDDDITHERIEDPELKPIINNSSPPITDYGY